ncbi:hypothetical protein AB5J49_36185 [Streptomyces sp. R28]|uniref:PASTA domain-containing protein n=1 Tax=Streptomyces sp. R28 TaxID=3238628 RepID=A0AB39Q6Q3_9ACTN
MPSTERPVARARRAKATELVERLLTEGVFVSPDDGQIAEWREVIGYAKQHGLEPPGERIEKVRFGAGGLELYLAEGPHPNARSRKQRGDASVVPAPTRLTSPHPIVAATLLPRYRNCRYNKATGATFAWCDFPGPLSAGAAYQTDAPVTAVADRTARSGNGNVSFTVWRTVDADYLSRLPASAPHGSGGSLRLRPVDGSGFTGIDIGPSESARGGLAFETTQLYDVEAVGFAITGRVGQVTDITVPYPRGNGWSRPDGTGEIRVTLPEGVTLIDVPPEPHSGDTPYCYPDPQQEHRAACPGPQPPGTVMRVRIDKRVDGARGRVTAHSDPRIDPNQVNNTAPVTVRYLG